MNAKPIRTKAKYRASLKEIEPLMTAKLNTPEGDRLTALTTLIEAYERARFPMHFQTPRKLSSSGWNNRV
jgi:HTH-type transcriptional regulator/antitoxin HigA